MKKKSLLFTICLLALALPSYSQTSPVATQTWFTIATLSGSANPLVTTTGPVTYWFGTNTGTTTTGVNCAIAPGCWLAPVTATLTNFPTLYSTFPKDPAPGLTKVFQIAETGTAITGTVGGVAFTVPALTAYTPTLTPGTVYALTFGNIAVIPGSPAATLLSTFSIPPWQFVAGVMQNFSMTTTYGGVTNACTFGGVTDKGVIALNCIPAPIQ